MSGPWRRIPARHRSFGRATEEDDGPSPFPNGLQKNLAARHLFPTGPRKIWRPVTFSQRAPEKSGGPPPFPNGLQKNLAARHLFPAGLRKSQRPAIFSRPATDFGSGPSTFSGAPPDFCDGAPGKSGSRQETLWRVGKLCAPSGGSPPAQDFWHRRGSPRDVRRQKEERREVSLRADEQKGGARPAHPRRRPRNDEAGRRRSPEHRRTAGAMSQGTLASAISAPPIGCQRSAPHAFGARRRELRRELRRDARASRHARSGAPRKPVERRGAPLALFGSPA
jgi:hypothetical protein